MDVGNPFFPKMLVMITRMAVYESLCVFFFIFIGIYLLHMVFNYIRTFSYKYMSYFDIATPILLSLLFLPIPCPVSSHCSSRCAVTLIRRNILTVCGFCSLLFPLFLRAFFRSFLHSFSLAFLLLFLDLKLIA